MDDCFFKQVTMSKLGLQWTANIPIINKNISKFRSTNLVKGNIKTSNNIMDNPIIIDTSPPCIL